MNKFIYAFFILGPFFLVSCGQSGSENPLTIQAFKENKIGSQIWMSENLIVDCFANGDPIKQALSAQDWEKASKEKKAAWCYYDFDEKNKAIYGVIYNWYAVSDPRGLAPDGWKIPSKGDVKALEAFLEEDSIEPSTKLKAQKGWNNNGNGTNTSGFNALPGGFCDKWGDFESIGKIGIWWTSTESENQNENEEVTHARTFSLENENDNLYTFTENKGSGCYIRCIKN